MVVPFCMALKLLGFVKHGFVAKLTKREEGYYKRVIGVILRLHNELLGKQSARQLGIPLVCLVLISKRLVLDWGWGVILISY
jgi:hypothetical protein